MPQCLKSNCPRNLTMKQILLHYVGMTTRISQAVVRRPSLPLTERDETDLEVLKATSQKLLTDLGLEVGTSESALLNSIHRAGMRSLTERIAELGYEQLAQQLDAETTEADTEVRKARRRHQVDAWGSE